MAGGWKYSPPCPSQAALGPIDINGADPRPSTLTFHREAADRVQVNRKISKQTTWILLWR